MSVGFSSSTHCSQELKLYKRQDVAFVMPQASSCAQTVTLTDCQLEGPCFFLLGTKNFILQNSTIAGNVISHLTKDGKPITIIHLIGASCIYGIIENGIVTAEDVPGSCD